MAYSDSRYQVIGAGTTVVVIRIQNRRIFFFGLVSERIYFHRRMRHLVRFDGTRGYVFAVIGRKSISPQHIRNVLELRI